VPIAVHENVAVGIFDSNNTGVEVVPEQISCESKGLVTSAIGYTVTTKLKGGVPAQNDVPGPVGVITYVTLPWRADPNGIMSRTSCIGPLPEAVKPETLPDVTEAVHVYVALATLLVG
jgi:hypothetical protein